MKQSQGNIYICTDDALLDKLYKEAGKPGLPCVPEKILWVPFKFRYTTN